MKPIPYGIASYKQIRELNAYYVDKTSYIPLLEQTGRFLFFPLLFQGVERGDGSTRLGHRSDIYDRRFAGDDG